MTQPHPQPNNVDGEYYTDYGTVDATQTQSPIAPTGANEVIMCIFSIASFAKKTNRQTGVTEREEHRRGKTNDKEVHGMK